jgi:hypothetical protein
MKVTKIPYFFYFTQNLINAKIKTDMLEINDKSYTLKKFNKTLFFLIKYIPIVLFFTLIFNEYDLSLSNTKIVQYIGAISIFILSLYNRIGMIISSIIIITVAILGVLNILPTSNFDVAYIVKYFIFLLTIYNFFTDTKKEIFTIFEDGKIKSHLIYERKENI